MCGYELGKSDKFIRERVESWGQVYDLDELDTRIVRELTQGGHVGLAWGDINPSYIKVSRKLGVSRETVRKRIEKMTKSGFLRAFPVQVHPSLLGLSIGNLSLEVPQDSNKEELLSELALVDGMILVATHVTNMVGVSFYYEDEQAKDRKVDLISRICNGTNGKFTRVPFPPCGIELSAKDWRIVAALQDRRDRPVHEIATVLGISTRTLKRRTKRMIDGFAIATMVSSDESKMSGGIIVNLIVEHGSERARTDTDSDLMKTLEPRLIYAGLWASFSLFTLVLPGITAAQETLEVVRGTSGVAQARLDLIEHRVEVYATFAERVKRKLKQVDAEQYA